MRRANYSSTRLLSAVCLAGLVLLAVWLWPTKQETSKSSETSSSSDSSQNSRNGFNKTRYPLDRVDSLWAVVNKGRALPSDYLPTELVTPDVSLRYASGSQNMQLRREAAAALEELFTAAAKQGLPLMLTSGYRSYGLQRSVYDGYVTSHGRSQADTFSARPGHSEHQIGLAADVEPADGRCELDICFGQTTEGRWLAAHADDYGFIIRYQKGQEKLTGYQYEPWHIRFVGVELAKQLAKSGQTMERFFDLPSYATYPAGTSFLK